MNFTLFGARKYKKAKIKKSTHISNVPRQGSSGHFKPSTKRIGRGTKKPCAFQKISNLDLGDFAMTSWGAKKITIFVEGTFFGHSDTKFSQIQQEMNKLHTKTCA